MYRYVRIIVIFLLLMIMLINLTGCSSSVAESHNGYKVVDESGREIYFSHKPERVMTLGMGTDGIVLGLLTPEKVVSVNSLADDPCSSNIVELANKIPKKHRNPSAEYVMSLQPDVVFVYEWTKSEYIDTMRDLGIKVIVLKGPHTITDIKQNITTVAAALQEQEKGKKLISAMDNELEKLAAMLKKRKPEPKKRVLLLSLMQTYGGIGCLYDDLCKEAGVINCLAEAGLHNGQALTKEMILKMQPDVIIMPVYNDHHTFDINKHNEEFLRDPALNNVQAVKNRQLYYPREGYIYNCSQDAVFGAVEIARAAYGEDFQQDAAKHITVM